MSLLRYNRLAIAVTVMLAFSSCDEDEERKSLRTPIDYTTLTASTEYSAPFVDETGTTTVDLFEGNTRLRMFQALNYYSTSHVSANKQIDSDTLISMFANTDDRFYNISTNTINVNGNELNNADFNLSGVVASTLPSAEAAAVRDFFEDHFEEIEVASLSISNTTPEAGEAGKLGNYLVDDQGIEIAQVIQKSLIGALQLDYIGNKLMGEGLTAENYSLSGDNNFTALEHNWDVAYGLLTLNPVFQQGATEQSRGPLPEFGMGSYVWEYNKANFANFHMAFLKGRAAIVNNDKATLQEQAEFIRAEMEKTVANAAIGYMVKTKQFLEQNNNAAAAHAFAEGLGFIYSLRFAEMHNADAQFSDGLISSILASENGFWDINPTNLTTTAETIATKFGL